MNSTIHISAQNKKDRRTLPPLFRMGDEGLSEGSQRRQFSIRVAQQRPPATPRTAGRRDRWLVGAFWPMSVAGSVLPWQHHVIRLKLMDGKERNTCTYQTHTPRD
jgi:hypothetical protein